MKKPSIQMLTGFLSSICIFGWLLFRVSNPCANLWEEARGNSLLLKLLEPSTPFFITIWAIVFAYRSSILNSSKLIHAQEKKELWPVEAWSGTIAFTLLIAVVALNAVDHRARYLASRIERIIKLCENDKDLEYRYLTMNTGKDLEEFVSLALHKSPHKTDVARIADTLGYY
jgi:hypothetical protein